MPDLSSVFAEMMKNPPDPNGPIPISNLPETMYGAVLPFFIISWIAVLSRLYVRFWVIREPGWDDYTIIMAALANLSCMVGYIGSVENGGMGTHILYLTQARFRSTMIWLYVSSGGYAVTSTFVKVSLLCQYLRIFRAGKIRITCYVLLVLVSLWGFAYCFLSFFPCIPIRGFWDRTLTTAKCYGLGFGDIKAAKTSFISFAAMNMAFDIAIFLIPMVEYVKLGLGRKQVVALTGLLTLGSVVVLMSILRLWTAVRNHQDTLASMDFTWWFPLTLIISCIELDFAIICASLPIFWPKVVVYLAQIFVTNEVHVTHHSRLDDDADGGPRSGRDYEMDVSRSWRESSEENLTRAASLGKTPKTDYSDPFVVDHVVGKVQERTQVVVEPVPKKTWWRYRK
ncbi:hypothetical protein K505DRAFT_418599 [Melanomma pulvis-pyrius CBS 109.77]|uniref:Rhodopsin domain-containing protein n=1 Tax=Melanomma pulvis-pyrius CBS 109.77 TaxID=1314802 RepID=A0A6A6X753_9PLEO|nr:hypothetical protein K505DRAFT_418599 [Melanomma pulvis-pyrius CBS 109.77]